MADVVTGQGAESPPFPEPSVQRFAIRILGLALFAYMAYATIYGPYKTTVVHLAIFAAAMLCISYLGRSRSTLLPLWPVWHMSCSIMNAC